MVRFGRHAGEEIARYGRPPRNPLRHNKSPSENPSEKRRKSRPTFSIESAAGLISQAGGMNPPYQSRSDCGAFRLTRYSCPSQSGSPLYRFFGAIPIRQRAPIAHCRRACASLPSRGSPPSLKRIGRLIVALADGVTR